MRNTCGKSALLTLAIGLGGSPAWSDNFSPYVELDPPRQLLWGDTHLHSSLSTDAFGFGVTLGPEDAYRFAAGETITSTHGEPARLARPLDFVVLADHAESFGLMNRVQAGDKQLIANEKVAGWHRALTTGTPEEKRALQRKFLTREGRWEAFGLLDELSTPELELDVWNDALAIAERHNRPGVFTTLLGYEWTSAPGGSNLHRVVIFRDGSDQAGRIAPLSSQLDDDPRALWSHLGGYEEQTGGQVLAIPHNGNLSNGLMFPVAERLHSRPVDAEYARQRARWEPVVEVTQIKGDGEAHPLLSPDDEFADYESWDLGNFEGKPKTPEMLPHEYARSALRNGLVLEETLGINPYQFGMIGATDSHTGLATADEDNFFGKHSAVEPGPERWQHPVGRAGDTIVRGWQMTSSGYAAVWARENSREAIWDAIKRREVYATTGSRMAVRFFGGWQFEQEDAGHPDTAVVGYGKGVPMGGELSADGETPSFLVVASRDPLGANLDRIQIVKGWLDDKGESHEKVYDVAWSGQRRPGPDGKLAAVGSTVDEQSATWRNSIGEPQLSTVWRDPDFDSAQSAFYYARVLEIPTPRWTAYERQRFGVSMGEEVPMATRERAYTSPIWYRPDSGK